MIFYFFKIIQKGWIERVISTQRQAVLWNTTPTTFSWYAFFFPYILWPEHKISNGACGVLEHYCSFYSISITWCAICVYACVFIPLVLLSCPCNFSHCLSPRIPWPIYTQLRAYWVWATCTNDWKHSRLKAGINPPVLQVKSTNHWYTQPKMFNAYYWNFAELNILMTRDIFMKLDTHMNDTVTVCLTLLWKITLSVSPFLLSPIFKIIHFHLWNAVIIISLELGSESVLRNKGYFWPLDLMHGPFEVNSWEN